MNYNFQPFHVPIVPDIPYPTPSSSQVTRDGLSWNATQPAYSQIHLSQLNDVPSTQSLLEYEKEIPLRPRKRPRQANDTRQSKHKRVNAFTLDVSLSARDLMLSLERQHRTVYRESAAHQAFQMNPTVLKHIGWYVQKAETWPKRKEKAREPIWNLRDEVLALLGPWAEGTVDVARHVPSEDQVDQRLGLPEKWVNSVVNLAETWLDNVLGRVLVEGLAVKAAQKVHGEVQEPLGWQHVVDVLKGMENQDSLIQSLEASRPLLERNDNREEEPDPYRSQHRRYLLSVARERCENHESAATSFLDPPKRLRAQTHPLKHLTEENFQAYLAQEIYPNFEAWSSSREKSAKGLNVKSTMAWTQQAYTVFERIDRAVRSKQKRLDRQKQDDRDESV